MPRSLEPISKMPISQGTTNMSIPQYTLNYTEYIKCVNGLDFSNANLSHVQFQEADLSDTKLQKADLSNSHFQKANFTRADLSGHWEQMFILFLDIPKC